VGSGAGATPQAGLDADRLATVRTLPVGSAKVPRFGVIEDVLAAPNEVAAIRALAERSAPFLLYAGQLEDLGYRSMAATVRRGVSAAQRNVAVLDGRARAPKGAHVDRLNADLLTVLELCYNATFKTAGLTTMEFCPWVHAGVERDELAACGVAGRTPELWLHDDTMSRVTQANEIIYRRAGGLLSAVREGAGVAHEHETLLGLVLDQAARTAPTAVDLPLRVPGDVPSVLKVDYKWGRDGDLVLVDITPGFMGVSFDDDLLDRVDAARPQDVRIAGRSAAAVFDALAARGLPTPRRVALTLLDEQMHRLWYDDDVAGFIAALRAEASSRGVPSTSMPILTLAGVKALAAGRISAFEQEVAAGEAPLLVGPEPWTGVPDLVVQYSFKVGRGLSPAESARLAAGGITLVDPGHHALFAVKEMAGREVLGTALPPGVVVPDVRPVGTVAHFPDGEGLVDAVWRGASGPPRWDMVTVKTEKLPRENAPGDYPTAYIFPVTQVGRRVAERQLPKVVRQLAEAGGGHLRLTLGEVQVEGGFHCSDLLRRDVEIRTYAHPVYE
jgi:hypothetical protein